MVEAIHHDVDAARPDAHHARGQPRPAAGLGSGAYMGRFSRHFVCVSPADCGVAVGSVLWPGPP